MVAIRSVIITNKGEVWFVLIKKLCQNIAKTFSSNPHWHKNLLNSPFNKLHMAKGTSEGFD